MQIFFIVLPRTNVRDTSANCGWPLLTITFIHVALWRSSDVFRLVRSSTISVEYWSVSGCHDKGVDCVIEVAFSFIGLLEIWCIISSIGCTGC